MKTPEYWLLEAELTRCAPDHEDERLAFIKLVQAIQKDAADSQAQLIAQQLKAWGKPKPTDGGMWEWDTKTSSWTEIQS